MNIDLGKLKKLLNDEILKQRIDNKLNEVTSDTNPGTPRSKSGGKSGIQHSEPKGQYPKDEPLPSELTSDDEEGGFAGFGEPMVLKPGDDEDIPVRKGKSGTDILEPSSVDPKAQTQGRKQGSVSPSDVTKTVMSPQMTALLDNPHFIAALKQKLGL